MSCGIEDRKLRTVQDERGWVYFLEALRKFFPEILLYLLEYHLLENVPVAHFYFLYPYLNGTGHTARVQA
jgi:hypothetical protein